MYEYHLERIIIMEYEKTEEQRKGITPYLLKLFEGREAWIGDLVMVFQYHMSIKAFQQAQKEEIKWLKFERDIFESHFIHPNSQIEIGKQCNRINDRIDKLKFEVKLE